MGLHAPLAPQDMLSQMQPLTLSQVPWVPQGRLPLHWQSPLTQELAPLPQALQLAPPVPHWAVVGWVMQTLVSQQPAQELGVQRQAPPLHSRPGPHRPPLLPQLQAPERQVSAPCGQGAQAAPLMPQPVLVLGGVQTSPWQQPKGQRSLQGGSERSAVGVRSGMLVRSSGVGGTERSGGVDRSMETDRSLDSERMARSGALVRSSPLMEDRSGGPGCVRSGVPPVLVRSGVGVVPPVELSLQPVKAMNPTHRTKPVSERMKTSGS